MDKHGAAATTSPASAQGADQRGPDSAFEASALDTRRNPARPLALSGPQRGLWLGLMALACLALALLAGKLAATPWVDAQWRADDHGAARLVASPLPALAALGGQTLVGIEAASGARLVPDALLLHTLPRWQVDNARRSSQVRQQQALWVALAQGPVQLHFGDGSAVTLQAVPRGMAGLGASFWLGSALALALWGLGLNVVMARPQARNALYMLMATCQAGQLMLLGAASLPGLGASWPATPADLWVPLMLDALTAAAALHALLLHPRRQPHAHLIACALWAVALASWCGAWLTQTPALWWGVQGLALASAALGWWLARHSHRIEANPFTTLIQRLTGLVGLGILAVTALVAATSTWPATAGPAAALGAWAWSLMSCACLLLMPFISRSRQVLRSIALLAGAATLAAASQWLFVTSLALGQTTSWMLAAAVGVAGGLVARRWALRQAPGDPLLDAERTFEQIYRAARELQSQPRRYRQLLGQLLRNIFEPREVLSAERDLTHARVIGSGAALEVPLRGSHRRAPGQPGPTLVLRYAGGGRRLFTDDDARLADRIVERLRRAVAYDRAVERGRSEERQRIAQDLHDDIGARLLTLLYQAPTPAMEEYIRLTLKDLKTLTRGLSAGEHRLSHAAGEWKADLAQRLAAAQMQLVWTFSHDRDVALTMKQWSALTRVLRELVSNVLQHAQATRVGIDINLEGPVLLLRVTDDGRGRAPDAWSHGLGLGGVRKRVKLIGGEVTWLEHAPQGIVCLVRVADFANQGELA